MTGWVIHTRLVNGNYSKYWEKIFKTHRNYHIKTLTKLRGITRLKRKETGTETGKKRTRDTCALGEFTSTRKSELSFIKNNRVWRDQQLEPLM
jgi:hypothetical protein